MSDSMRILPVAVGKGVGSGVGSFTFVLFCYFLVDFFLHLSARIPGYGAIRPTLLLVLSLTLLLFFQRERFKGWTNDSVIKAMLAFIIYLALSLPFVEWPGSVLRNNLSDFVKVVVFIFFIVLIIDSDRRLKIFLAVFIGCQLIRVFEPLFLNITEGYWGSKTHLGHGEFSKRLSGAPSDVINPNELGFVIVTVIPFLHYLVWSGNAKAKLFYLLTMPALLYALILTQSRGALLALFVVGWMVLKASKNKAGLIALVIVVAIAGWSVMSGEQKDRYLSLVGMSDSANTATAEGRLSGIMNEFQLGLNRPIVGHGLGTTPEAKTNVLGKTQAAHNFYAELLIETGILGLIFFIRFLVKVHNKLRKNGRFLKAAPDDDRIAFYRRLNQALVAVFWMYVVYSSNYWGLSQYYWYLFAGLTIVFSNRLTQVMGNKTSQTSVDINEHAVGKHGRLKYGQVHRKRELQ
ncbi:O-antigen ligase family protein [Marinobacter sp.]|uniref:O-antigen ligase family protein n=1 Tax=Marinobacter sp. TaxID=50741 RepID=UPI0035C66C50